MLNDLISEWLRWLGGSPCFRVYGRVRHEKRWRVIDVYASHRRDLGSRWPLFGGHCTTWSDNVIAVGWDFAGSLLREQTIDTASQQRPVEVSGGRIRDVFRRAAAGGSGYPTASEVLAHECGHTWQARQMGWFYLPVVGSVTLFREGPYPWNRFENEASEVGQFGGVVHGSVSSELARLVDITQRTPPLILLPIPHRAHRSQTMCPGL